MPLIAAARPGRDEPFGPRPAGRRPRTSRPQRRRRAPSVSAASSSQSVQRASVSPTGFPHEYPAVASIGRPLRELSCRASRLGGSRPCRRAAISGRAVGVPCRSTTARRARSGNGFGFGGLDSSLGARPGDLQPGGTAVDASGQARAPSMIVREFAARVAVSRQPPACRPHRSSGSACLSSCARAPRAPPAPRLSGAASRLAPGLRANHRAHTST